LAKVFYIGNPLRPDGPFFECFRSAQWKTFQISALDSPNVKTGKEIVPGLSTREWVRARTEEWGKDTPAYQARILGEFPDESEDAVIPLAWASASILDDGESVPRQGAIRMGCDIARYGSDRTVFVIRDEREIHDVVMMQKQSTMKTVGGIVDAMKRLNVNAENIFVDDAGLGGGVTDRLYELGHKITPVNFGASPIDKERFLNVRSECYWNMRDAFKPDGEAQLRMARKYEPLAMECVIAKKQLTSKGQIKLEPKDDIKKRTGKSPDLADALALTYAGSASGGGAAMLNTSFGF